MRNPALLLVVAFAVACASSPTTPIPGRHALVLERTSAMRDPATEPFESQIEATLATRLESLTRVDTAAEGAGYDDVIVIKWGSQYRPSLSPRTPDADERAAAPPTLMANYEIFRGGQRVGSGYLSVAGTTVAAAVNSLAADISRKLAR